MSAPEPDQPGAEPPAPVEPERAAPIVDSWTGEAPILERWDAAPALVVPGPAHPPLRGASDGANAAGPPGPAPFAPAGPAPDYAEPPRATEEQDAAAVPALLEPDPQPDAAWEPVSLAPVHPTPLRPAASTWDEAGEPDPRDGPPPPATRWVWGTWLLIMGLVAIYVLLGPGPTGEVAAQRLERAGGLIPHAPVWRLIRASFLHGGAETLFVGLFLLLCGGAAVERTCGRGALLALFVIGGAAVDRVRCGLETPLSLLELSGAWPAATLLLGACLALGRRTQTGIAAALLAGAVAGAMLLGVAAMHSHAVGPLLASLGVALGLGLLLGTLLPLPRPGTPPLAGCLLGLLAVSALGLAGLGRAASGAHANLPPPPWSPPTPPPELAQGLTARPLPDLGVQLGLPARWDPQGSGRPPVECPRCDTELGPPRSAPGQPEERRRCPKCQKDVRPRSASYLLFLDPSRERRVQVWTRPRGAFDAADTLAGNVLAGMDRADGPLRDPRLRADEPFPGAMGAGHLVWLETSTSWGEGRDTSYRMYFFVGKQRTARVDALAPHRDDQAEEAADMELFDAIARSLEELPE